MSINDQFEEEPGRQEKQGGSGDLAEGEERELEQSLRNFRLSVHAWSEAAYIRPRTVVTIKRARSWRRAAGWALGCVLVAGGVSGGVYEHRQVQEQARIAAVKVAEQRRIAAEQRAREEEELLARVDTDVSREVPSAMEPLAQMAEDETR